MEIGVFYNINLSNNNNSIRVKIMVLCFRNGFDNNTYIFFYWKISWLENIVVKDEYLSKLKTTFFVFTLYFPLIN